MKAIFTAVVFLILMVAVLSRTVSQYPGEPLGTRIDAELRCLTHPH